MTKISFDVDFTKDPEQILKEIQERAKAEVEKREKNAPPPTSRTSTSQLMKKLALNSKV